MEKEKDIFVEGEHIENLFSDELSPFLKQGSAWLFAIGFTLFSMTYFIRWPEVAKSEAILTTAQNPYVVVPKMQGKLVSLYFKNEDPIKKGELIGAIENAADPHDINLLEGLMLQIDTIYQTRIEDVNKISIHYFELSKLGEIQPAYEQFLRSYHELRFALSNDFLSNKLMLINQRIATLKALGANLESQKNTINKDYQLALTTYEKEKELFEKGSTTAYELKDQESLVLSKKLSCENIKSAIILNERQQEDLLEEKIQMTQIIETQKNSFVQAYKTLKFSISQWKSSYHLISPSDGLVSMPAYMQAGSIVSPQSPVVYVIPAGTQPVIQLKLAQYNMSAIDTSKLVRIKLVSYPYEEYGVLEGRIKSISQIPSEDGLYDATVYLNNGLTTSLNKKIHMVNGLRGEAEIVLEEQRLMTRLFNKFRRKATGGTNPE